MKQKPINKVFYDSKFALLSHILPPSPSGQAIILYRILKNIPAQNYCLISKEDYTKKIDNKASEKLKARYYHLSSFTNPKPVFLPYPIYKLFKIFSKFYSHLKTTSSILKTEKCNVLVVCTGDIYDLVSGFLLSKILKIPLVLYVFDDIANQVNAPKLILKTVSLLTFKFSAKIIVPNEFLKKTYLKSYKVISSVIHNPVKSSKRVTPANFIKKNREIKICYTGAIYEAHYDAFKSLTTSLLLIKKYPLKLHLYSFQHKNVLSVKDILVKNVVHHDHIHQKNINNTQQNSDILYLPLAFHSPYPEIIRTSSPGKMGEYLLSGKPILVHAPKSSFISWYFQKYKCGVVVNTDDPSVLSAKILNLIENTSLQRKITLNAIKRAEKDFSLELAVNRFIKIINSAGRLK